MAYRRDDVRHLFQPRLCLNVPGLDILDAKRDAALGGEAANRPGGDRSTAGQRVPQFVITLFSDQVDPYLRPGAAHIGYQIAILGIPTRVEAVSRCAVAKRLTALMRSSFSSPPRCQPISKGGS